MFHRKPAQTKIGKGAAIECAAAAWLQQQGLICLERNFRCKGGEIDLIMRDRCTLVFVEVRLRNRDDFGSATESVTASKQRRVAHAAQYFLANRAGYRDEACRFDVMAAKCVDAVVIWEWVQAAFCAA